MGGTRRSTAPACADCVACLLGAPVIDMPTQAQREEGWKAGLSFMEKWRHGVRPDNQAGQFDRQKPPIPANFGRVLQRALWENGL